MSRTIALAAAAVALGMTAVPATAKPLPEPSFEATLPLDVQAPRANGGIFQPVTGYAALHEGTRAKRVGDPLTILLLESTTTSKSVSSKSNKGGNLAIVLPTTGPFSLLSADALKAASNSSFNGQGNAGQTSTLSGALSVTIAEVRPNGTALVKGEKQMLLSQGNEWIRFSGIVRLADIDTENRIASSRVADARIEYSGKGAIQNASRQGWLGRFFNVISPF